jgi:hypothetical protein
VFTFEAKLATFTIKTSADAALHPHQEMIDEAHFLPVHALCFIIILILKNIAVHPVLAS